MPSSSSPCTCPAEVTFFDDRMLTDDLKIAKQYPNLYKWIGEDDTYGYKKGSDDYAFYVERLYKDRNATTADIDAGEYVVDKKDNKLFETDATGKVVTDARATRCPRPQPTRPPARASSRSSA